MLLRSKLFSMFGATVCSAMLVAACGGDETSSTGTGGSSTGTGGMTTGTGGMGTGGMGTGGTGGGMAAMKVRKNAKDLTAQEKMDFVDAIKALKAKPSPYDSTVSHYDQFSKWHLEANFCADASKVAHMNNAFLPWHRVMLYYFEEALREVSGKDITVPYWDWTDPASKDAIFKDDFMGGDGDPNDNYAVNTGPFKKGVWELVVQNPDDQLSALPYIVRHFGDPSALPKATDVSAVLAIPEFNAAPWDIMTDSTKGFQIALEGWVGFTGMGCPMGKQTMQPQGMGQLTMHNAVHLWVGGATLVDPMDPMKGAVIGTMLKPESPNDPVFYLHHANVDRLWQEWQTMHGKDKYAPMTGGPAGTNFNDKMDPFDTLTGPQSPADVIDNDKLMVTYK